MKKLFTSEILLLLLAFVFYVHYTVFAWFLTSLLVGVGMNATRSGINYVVLLFGYVAIAPPLSFAAEVNVSLGRKIMSLGTVLASSAMYIFLLKYEDNQAYFCWSILATLAITTTYATSASMLSTCALDAISAKHVNLSWGVVRAAMNLGGASACGVVLLAAYFFKGPLSWNEPASLTRAISRSVARYGSILAFVSFLLTLALEFNLNKKKARTSIRALPIKNLSLPDHTLMDKLVQLCQSASDDLWAFYLLLFFLGIATKAFDTFVIIYLIDSLNVSVTQLATALFIEMSSAALINMIWDFFNKSAFRNLTNGRTTLLVVSAVVFFRVVLIAIHPNLLLIMISQAAAGIWWALLNAVTQDFAHKQAPNGLETTAVAVSQAVYVGLGGLSGSIVGIYIQARFGWVSLFNGALFVSMLTSVLASLLVFRIPRIARASFLPSPFARSRLAPRGISDEEEEGDDETTYLLHQQNVSQDTLA